jgi:hypothetical protein
VNFRRPSQIANYLIARRNVRRSPASKMKRSWFGVALALALIANAPINAQQVDLSSGSVVEIVAKLRPGEYVWAPEIAPKGPMLLIVNLQRQRALLYRNGVPIGASTVSTGRPGHQTPVGVFTILQKHVAHFSSKYDSAPMPYMERLTWYGIALHAGHLPGYPASHGCIRLPRGFAKLLYGLTSLGMTVVISDEATTPRVAPAPYIVSATPTELGSSEAMEWHPERSPSGPVSVIVSAADHRAVILRNGVIIGSAPVTVLAPVTGTWAYMLRSIDAQGQRWTRLDLSPVSTTEAPVSPDEWQRFDAPVEFKRLISGIVQPGMTIVVTPDSLRPGVPATILESDN